jgi:hypothetical protein
MLIITVAWLFIEGKTMIRTILSDAIELAAIAAFVGAVICYAI